MTMDQVRLLDAHRLTVSKPEAFDLGQLLTRLNEQLRGDIFRRRQQAR